MGRAVEEWPADPGGQWRWRDIRHSGRRTAEGPTGIRRWLSLMNDRLQTRMLWRQNITEKLADWLRFAVRGCMLVSAIAASLATTYVCVKFCFRLAEWLDKVALSHPW